MFNIYLAGEIDHVWRHQLFLKIREELLHYPITLLNPEQISITQKPHEIVKYDLLLIKQAHLIICYLHKDHYPVGTICELFEAYKLNIPIILLLNHNVWDRYVNNIWINVMVDFVFKVDNHLCPFLEVRERILDIINMIQSCSVKEALP